MPPRKKKSKTSNGTTLIKLVGEISAIVNILHDITKEFVTDISQISRSIEEALNTSNVGEMRNMIIETKKDLTEIKTRINTICNKLEDFEECMEERDIRINNLHNILNEIRKSSDKESLWIKIVYLLLASVIGALGAVLFKVDIIFRHFIK